MKRKRVKINLTFEANMDPVPGWGYDVKDWVRLVEGLGQAQMPHYHPTVKINEVETYEKEDQ